MVGFATSRTKRGSLSPSRANRATASPAAAAAGGASSAISPATAALCLFLLILVFVALSPNCLGLAGGGRGEYGEGRALHGAGSLINETTAEEINQLVMKFEKINLQGRSKADSSVAAVFSAANTAFKYHMQQRAASFVRDKVGPEDKLRWTQAKMREIFLVPVYTCPVQIRVGEWGEGGKWLCNIFPFRHALRREVPPEPGLTLPANYARRLDWKRAPVVYSVGSRDETSFEEAVFKLLNVKPTTMDPSLTQAKQEHLQSLPFINFRNTGLTGKGKKQGPKSWGPLMRLTEVMAMLNNTYVDVLKIDCEGCEIDVMRDLLEQFGGQPPVGQVLMEIHHVYIPKVQLELLLMMERLGFRMFHSENNERYLKAHEVAYIHESLVDPALWPYEAAGRR